MNARRLGIALLAVGAVGGAMYLSLPKNPNRETKLEGGTIYYTGPMKARGSGAKSYGYEDGTVAPTPPKR